MRKLYHKDIYLPNFYDKPTGIADIRYGQHAIRSALTDRYAEIKLPKQLNLDELETIEVQYDTMYAFGGSEFTEDLHILSKIVLRGQHDDTNDVCYVLIPDGGGWFCKTVWLNKRSDTHKTLRKELYEQYP